MIILYQSMILSNYSLKTATRAAFPFFPGGKGLGEGVKKAVILK
jgi:hypothetical protein